MFVWKIQIRPRSVVSCEGKYGDGENDQQMTALDL
jgi:hypothetical protein